MRKKKNNNGFRIQVVDEPQFLGEVYNKKGEIEKIPNPKFGKKRIIKHRL